MDIKSLKKLIQKFKQSTEDFDFEIKNSNFNNRMLIRFVGEHKYSITYNEANEPCSISLHWGDENTLITQDYELASLIIEMWE